jgi:hypothetical protein
VSLTSHVEDMTLNSLTIILHNLQSRAFHPDKQTDKQYRSIANENFRLVEEAYTILKDPRKRRVYDMYGRKVRTGKIIFLLLMSLKFDFIGSCCIRKTTS